MENYTLINHCQVCSKPTEEIMSLGSLPLADALSKATDSVTELAATYPTPLLYCPHCKLVQLGCIVDHRLLFPVDYPYTSGTTRVIRENFSELARECIVFVPLDQEDLIVDIGCNDGTMLSNFKEHCRVLGITPEDMGEQARQQGIPVMQAYFRPDMATNIVGEYGHASLVTATNVFAHFPDVHEALEAILDTLAPQGIFLSESGYLHDLIDLVQYDSIHHEHLRYYSLTSLSYLLGQHGMQIIHAKRIRPHGGSIRVYAARSGQREPTPEVQRILHEEKQAKLDTQALAEFKAATEINKVQLNKILTDLTNQQKVIYGIGAPARATVLVNYVGMSENMIECVCEIKGSHKIGYCVPGTRIKIVDEQIIFERPPDYALILSWHIAVELMTKMKTQGFAGDFIIPLPSVKIIKNADV